jgi:hypothetical protein
MNPLTDTFDLMHQAFFEGLVLGPMQRFRNRA